VTVDLAQLLSRVEEAQGPDRKPCEFCAGAMERPKKLSQGQWDRRRFCSQSCNTRSKNAVSAVPLSRRLHEQSTLDAGTGCIVWTGPLDKYGYGRITVSNRPRRAHVVAYEEWRGPRGGLHVLHDCDNRRCINAAHLFLGTNADNTADRNAKGRQARGEGHARAKLTEGDVLAIRASAVPHTVLAAHYGVGETAISNIRNRRSWKHVAG
jgi:hypothetical protein